MKQKALENLQAARLLTAQVPPLSNAAVSRAYYAAYHACWHVLENQGYEVPDHDGRRYWRHDTFPIEALRAGVVDEDGREAMEELYAARLTADYFEDDLLAEQALHLVARARSLIDSVRLEER